jgi:hypothetical protein
MEFLKTVRMLADDVTGLTDTKGLSNAGRKDPLGFRSEPVNESHAAQTGNVLLISCWHGISAIFRQFRENCLKTLEK